MRNVFRIGGQKKSLWLERLTAPVASSKPEAVGGSPGSRTWSSAAPRPRTARSAYADFLSPTISPGEHGVAERVIRGTVLRGFSEDRIVHLPGGVQVRRVALDDLPQDLDRQHWLDPYRTLRRIAT